ncbi:MAG: hypothetical protein V4640_14965 [Verrucomicrobiota bacterium]
MKNASSQLTVSRLSVLVLGILIFAVLMGIRDEIPSMWLRALVAGCAAVILLVSILHLRKP